VITVTVFLLDRLLVVSSQVMESFVAHVCLVRPLGEGGKMRLAMDLAQLELVLGLFCHGDVARLGQPYKMLRALRSVVSSVCNMSCMHVCMHMYTQCSTQKNT